jgi:hypothetical protein
MDGWFLFPRHRLARMPHDDEWIGARSELELPVFDRVEA